MPGTRRLLVFAGVALLIAVVGLAALYIALSRGFQRDRIRHQLEVALSDGLGVPVGIEALEGTLWPRAVARGVSLGPADAPLVQIDELSLAFDGFDLLARRLTLSHANVRGLRVALGAWPETLPGDVDADGEEASASWLPRVEIEGVSLTESTWHWTSAEASFSARVDLRGRGVVWPPPARGLPIAQLSVVADVDGVLDDETAPRLRLEGELDAGRIALSTLDLRTGGRRLTLEGDALAALSDDGIEIERLRLKSGPEAPTASEGAPPRAEETGGVLDLAGSVGPNGYRGLTLSGRGLDVALLSVLAPPPFPLEGRLDFDLALDGSLARPDLDASLDWRNGRAAAMRDLALHATVVGRKETLRADVDLEQAGRPLAVARGQVPLPFTLEKLRTSPAARVEVEAESLDLALLAPLLPDALTHPSGTASIDLVLSGGAPPVLAGRVAVEDAALELAGAGGLARADVLELGIEGFDLDTRSLMLSEVRGRGLQGVFDGSRADVSEAEGEPIEGPQPPALQVVIAQLHLIESALHWVSPDGNRLDARLDLDGRMLSWPAPSEALPAEHLRLAGDAEIVAGGLDSRLQIEGELVQGRIGLSRLGLRSVGHDLTLDGPGVATVTREGIEIERFRLRGASSELEVTGGIDWRGFRGLELRGRGLRTAPLGLLAALPFEVEGRFDLDLALDGVFSLPELEATLDWRDARMGTMDALRVRGDVRTEAGLLRFSFQPERVGQPAGLASAQIPYPFTTAGLAASPTTLAALKAEALDLSLLAPLLPEGVSEPAGTAKVDLRLRGGSPPELAGTLELDDGSIVVADLGEDALEPIEVHLALVPGARGVRIDTLRVATPLGAFEGDGLVDPFGRQDLRLALSEVDAVAVARGLGLDWGVEGRIEASLRLEGSLEAPTFEAEAHWVEARMGLAAADRVDLRAEADGRQLVAEARVVEGGREALKARIRGSVASLLAGRLGRDVEMRFEGSDFQLASLAPLLPRRVRDLTGRADLTLEVHGGAPPALSGSIDLADGSLRVPLLNQTFAPIEGRVRFDGLQIEPELRLGEPGAGAALTGALELGASSDGSLLAALRPQSADLVLELDHLPLARSRVVTADAHGSARASGPIDALSLTGDVLLERARLRMPEAEDPIFREIRIVASEPRTSLGEVDSGPGVFERAEAQMKLRLPRGSWLRGRGVELELEGEFEVEKRALRPARFKGGVRVLRGRYALYGRRFDVRRGSVVFDGSAQPDPRVDIEAHHRVRDVVVIARVSGRLSSPELQLSGDPPMSESDVLSYLLAGRPAHEMGSSGGGFDAAAAQLAAGIAANEALAVLDAGDWVDSIDVRVGESGSPEEVGVGRYMTRDLFVRYGRGFGEEPSDRIGIELRLSDHWSLESDLATDESAGADLIWSMDF
jgi:autotransporter translocation and assembly factor TamB